MAKSKDLIGLGRVARDRMRELHDAVADIGIAMEMVGGITASPPTQRKAMRKLISDLQNDHYNNGISELVDMVKKPGEDYIRADEDCDDMGPIRMVGGPSAPKLLPAPPIARKLGG